MRVLVTGANGRVGRRVVHDLLEEGHEVTGLDAVSARGHQLGASQVQGSVEDRSAVAEAMVGSDAVVHLAALMSWVRSDAADLLEANVKGTFHVLEESIKRGVQRLVFASSGDVYPETGPAFLPVDEHHPTRPTSHYGMTKLLGEQMVSFYTRRFGLSAVILRFEHTQDAAELLDPKSFFSGPRFFLKGKIRQQEMLGNDEALRILERLDDGPEKLLLSRGQDGTPYRMGICDTRDLSRGVVLALGSPKAAGEVIGIGPDEAVSFEVAVPLMREATGLPMVEADLPGSAVNYATSNSKARELLGFRPQWDFASMLEEATTQRTNDDTRA